MTELVQYQPHSLSDQMEFARAVVHRPEGAAASLLPQAYRDNPGNVLLAVGLGSSMGLSPAESLYRIDVIQGKPCAAAELISANVRKAGHKLRVKVTEDPPSATCTIIRADDPDEPTVITRDMGWAQRMGLTGKDNYKKQPSTMLAWRAISACARLACPEALYGVVYTSDEMYDDSGARVERQAGGLGAALAGGTTTAEQIPQTSDPDATPGISGSVESIATSGSESPLLNTSSALAKRLFATMGEAGFTERDDRLAYASKVLGRPVASSKELTDADAETIIAATEAVLAEPFPTGGEQS